MSKLHVNRRFFPLYESQIENDEEFRTLSPLKKVYYFLLQSRFNQSGSFYCRDANFAVALNCSVESIQKARREFVEKGWIRIKSGHRDKSGRGISTKYEFVRWATVNKDCSSERFERFHQCSHDILELLLYKGVQANKINHETVVVYLILEYWHAKIGYEEPMFIMKRKLCELTGIKSQYKLHECIKQLADIIVLAQTYDADHNKYTYESPIFKFRNNHHKYEIEELVVWAETLSISFWEHINLQGGKLQQIRLLKEGEKIAELFNISYQKKYMSDYEFTQEDYMKLKAISIRYGYTPIMNAIETYFSLDMLPSNFHSTSDFLNREFWKVRKGDKGSVKNVYPP